MAEYKQKVRLNSANSIIKLMARVTNMLFDDTISIDKAKAIGYMCNIMIKGFEIVEQEEQIKLLTERIEELTKNE